MKKWVNKLRSSSAYTFYFQNKLFYFFRSNTNEAVNFSIITLINLWVQFSVFVTKPIFVLWFRYEFVIIVYFMIIYQSGAIFRKMATIYNTFEKPNLRIPSAIRQFGNQMKLYHYEVFSSNVLLNSLIFSLPCFFILVCI